MEQLVGMSEAKLRNSLKLESTYCAGEEDKEGALSSPIFTTSQCGFLCVIYVVGKGYKVQKKLEKNWKKWQIGPRTVAPRDPTLQGPIVRPEKVDNLVDS